MAAAGTPVAQAESDETIQLVTFMLADEEYGFRIVDVQEIIRMRNVRITEIPNAPRFVLGVINLRGRMIAVVDLRTRFGLPAQDKGRTSRIVVLNAGDRTVGTIVDAVVEVVRVPSSSIETLPDLVTTVDSDFIQGITRVDERMIVALDIREMFSSAEHESMGNLAGAAGTAEVEVAQ